MTARTLGRIDCREEIMSIYVGYGFNAKQLPKGEWLRLLATYGGNAYKTCVEWAKKAFPDMFTEDIAHFLITHRISSKERLYNAVMAAGGTVEHVPNGIENIDMDVLSETAVEVLKRYYGCCADFLCGIINENEKDSAGTSSIVSPYDSWYVVFDSISFIDEDEKKRARYIPTKEAFINMISRYVSTEGVRFMPLWADCDTQEMALFFED